VALDPAGGPGEPRPGRAAELARQVCLNELAARPRTRAELAGALRRRGFDEVVVAEVLDRYDEVGIIDDDAFARAWVTSRHHGRGLARRALAGELRRKGVAAETVGEALAELDPSTEEATARELVTRKLRADRRARSGRPGQQRPDATLRRLVGMLARKGYPPGLAVRVVKEVLAESPEGADFAADIDVDALVEAVGGDDERQDMS
jgi:regulatory protein